MRWAAVSTSSTDGVWVDRRLLAPPTGGGLVLLVVAASVQVGDDLDPGANHGRGPRR
jgi:hypothetical protein